MIKRNVSTLSIALMALLLNACSSEQAVEQAVGVEVGIDLQVTVDEKPVEGAQVSVDGSAVGTTDKDGMFTHVLERKAQDEVVIEVTAEPHGYRTQPWTEKFVVKKRENSEQMDRHSYSAALDVSARYISIAAQLSGKPVSGATVKINNKTLGKTDDQGVYIHEYNTMPKNGFNIRVSKRGLTTFREQSKPDVGDRLKAELYKRPVVRVKARTEAYGVSKNLADVEVYFGDKAVGKTNENGSFAYFFDQKPGDRLNIRFAKEGYISVNEMRLTLRGDKTVHAYLYPVVAKPIRIGVLPFASNTPGVFLGGVIAEAQEEFHEEFFDEDSFVAVDKAKLDEAMARSRMTVDKITTKGWSKTSMRDLVDMMLVGSVSQEEDGDVVVEGKIYNAKGKLMMSHIARDGDADDAGEEVGINLVENFPYEGRLLAIDDGIGKISLGSDRFDLGIREGFELSSTKYDGYGEITAHSVIAQGDMHDREDDYSLIELSNQQQDETPVGTRVVRVSEEDARSNNSLIILAQGGVDDDVSPLAGVNVYLGERWAGVTNRDGKVTLKVREGKSYDVTLYKHGYQQSSNEVEIASGVNTEEYVLKANNSMFTITSDPSGAEVFVDEKSIGKTPITKAVPITLGFHRVRVSLNEDYRDWEEIVEFSGKEMALTGEDEVQIFEDYLRMGDAAESRNKVDEAIAAYSKANKGHPDYAQIRNRLAQIYLDDKSDYDAAIREFNRVVALPEVEELVLKQYAIVYTNLGNAQYEKGNALVRKNKREASKYLAAAVKSLDRAKGNVRFFPTEMYDEAVHDTYYYSALAYHKLFEVTQNRAVLDKADLAWQEYFDFYPDKLSDRAEFVRIKTAAQKMWDQLAEQL